LFVAFSRISDNIPTTPYKKFKGNVYFWCYKPNYMNINYSLFVIAAIAVISAPAQTCLKFKEGQKYTLKSDRYNNDEVFTPAYAKMKESKREQKAAEFNAKVNSGEIRSASGSYVYDVKNISLSPGLERAVLVTEIAGKKYESIIACNNDTMYFTRITGLSYLVDTNGDTLGFGILGLQVIPNKIKVGDVLMPYEDIGVMFPKTITYTAKHDVFKGYQTSVTRYRDIGYDPNARPSWGLGTTTKTTTKALYESVDVKVRETTQFSNVSVNYAKAVVVAEEEVTIDGVNYKAYKIESESWLKPQVTKSYESSNEEWSQARKKSNEDLKLEMTARGVKKGYLNEQGYTVSYRTEWFVPGIGVVKADIYDNFGNILARSSLSSIK
jgi:hypothetical protein